MKTGRVNYYSLLCSLLALALGVVVIFGWHTGDTALIQVNPSFAPMQYNTALCFLLSGSSLLLLVSQKHIPAALLGLVVVLVGVATLCEYLFEINLGIDQFFMDQPIMTKSSHPGRMAPNTALAFTLTGLALVWGGRKRSVIISLAMAVLALSVMSLVGYTFREEGIYGWGNLTRMAIHTASGFLVMGAGLIFYGALRQSRRKFDLWELTPVSVATVVVVITFFSWLSIGEATKARNTEYFDTLVSDTQAALHNRYDLYEQSLWGGLGLFYASTSVERGEWAAYVKAVDVENHLPGISGLGYIDYILTKNINEYTEHVRQDGAPNFTVRPDTFYPDKFVIKYIEPAVRNSEAMGLDIGFEANRRAAAERARDLGVPALTKKIVLVQDQEKEAGFLLLIPVYNTKKMPADLLEKREHFQGWVYAPFIGSDFLEGLADISMQQVDFEVYDGRKVVPDTLIYKSAEFLPDAEYAKTTKVQIAGRTWSIRWQSSENFRPPANENMALIVAAFGFFFAAFLYFALSRLVRSKEMIAREVERQTEKLAENEKELVKTLSFQDLVTNTIPDLIFVKDSEYRIVQANEAFLDLYPDEQRDKVIGTTTIESYSEEDARAFLEYDRLALENGYSETEETVVFPHGRKRTLFTKKVRFTNPDGEKFILGIARDITEQQEQQERMDLLKGLLIASGQTETFEEFLKTVLSMICEYIAWPVGHAYVWDEKDHVLKPSGCWYFADGDTDFSEFKSVTENMTFIPGKGLPGRVYTSGKPAWIRDVATDPNFPRNKILTDINLCSGFGLPVFLDNDVRVVLEFFSPDVIAEDTELLRLWEAVAHQLSRVIERSERAEERALYMDELEKAKEDALYANMMKSEFLANMSHEIRTPLNGVIGAADLMKKTKVSPTQKKYLDVIMGSGDTLLALINDILDLSKIEAGEIEINPEPVSIRRLIKDSLRSVTPRAKDKNITLKESYADNVPEYVLADVIRLSQIMINLLGNAVKFVSEGYVAVSVEAEEEEDNLVTLIVSVEDTGIGIPEDKLDIIFDKFSQADATTTKKYGGTGLGLAITQRLVELMGGTIGVKSEVGKGATFRFEITVPVLEAAETSYGSETALETQTDDVQAAGQKLNARILLVENEIVNQMVATDMLEGLGCTVDLAENGQEAVDKLFAKGAAYDIVLMDCMMPVMDGFEATQEIRRREKKTKKHRIIIAMTANAMAGEKDKCFEIGMDDYLSKPVKEETLYAKLAEYLTK